MIKSMFYAGNKLIVVTPKGAKAIAGEPESLKKELDTILEEEGTKVKGLIFEKVFDSFRMPWQETSHRPGNL